MSTALCFNDIPLSPVTHQNRLWIRAAELARALGYKREDKIARIYQRNSDEFTPDMTQLIESVVEPQFEGLKNLSTGRCRIFSLRGCHLLAMFARTPVAKAFRKWVLDVLDKLAAEEQAALPEVPHFVITPSAPASRKPLRSLVNAWARISGQHQETLWPQVKAHFQLERIDDLPEEWIPDALEWVQGKVDQCVKALPSTLAGQPPNADSEPGNTECRLLLRTAFTAPMAGNRLYMSACIWRYSILTFSAQRRPLNGAPFLLTHSGEPSRHSAKARPKFSAGTACSHSTQPARFPCAGGRIPRAASHAFEHRNPPRSKALRGGHSRPAAQAFFCVTEAVAGRIANGKGHAR